MHVPTVGLAQRCMHVVRALAPDLSPTVADTLLSAAQQCCKHPSLVSFDFLAEVLIALRELLARSSPQQVRPC